MNNKLNINNKKTIKINKNIKTTKLNKYNNKMNKFQVKWLANKISVYMVNN